MAAWATVTLGLTELLWLVGEAQDLQVEIKKEKKERHL